MWCKSCRVTGYTHCAHPDECGNMVTLTAAADSWKSWLDDAPLPETFNSATGGLQDFITALSRALLTARAELAPTTTDPGDGWTWNERLGWIGPDGKPADPRRRG